MIGSERVERLVRVRSDGLGVLSVYFQVPTDPDALRAVKARVEELTRGALEAADAAAAASDTTTEPPRAGRPVRAADVAAVRQAVEHARDWLGHSVALFAAPELGGIEEILLPCPVPDFATFGTRPYLRYLLIAQQRCLPYCVAVIEGGQSRIAVSRGGRLSEIRKITGGGLRKPDFAGWYGLLESRVRRRSEALRQRHYRVTQDAIRQVMRQEEARLLVVGGHDHEVPQFVASLPAPLRAAHAGNIVVDLHAVNWAKVGELAEQVVADWRRGRAAREVEDVLADAATSGRAVAGLDKCLAAASSHAVDLLLVPEDDRRPGFACPACGLLTARAQTCASCGAVARPVADVVEETAALVRESGGEVHYIPDNAALAACGMAARLRFPLESVADQAEAAALRGDGKPA